MTTATVTWRDIPPGDIVRLLGENGDGFHPRDICDPEWIHQEFGIPLEVLPVEELVADEQYGIYLERGGKPVACMQGVVAAHMICDIGKALGVTRPADARKGFSGGLFDLAAAIVKHLKAQLLGFCCGTFSTTASGSHRQTPEGPVTTPPPPR